MGLLDSYVEIALVAGMSCRKLCVHLLMEDLQLPEEPNAERQRLRRGHQVNWYHPSRIFCGLARELMIKYKFSDVVPVDRRFICALQIYVSGCTY